MKLFKKIFVISGSAITTLTLLMSVMVAFGPISYGGCFDSTKEIGFPLPFYITSGEYITCGEGSILARFNLAGLLIDLVVAITILYWISRLYSILKVKFNKH